MVVEGDVGYDLRLGVGELLEMVVEGGKGDGWVGMGEVGYDWGKEIDGVGEGRGEMWGVEVGVGRG